MLRKQSAFRSFAAKPLPARSSANSTPQTTWSPHNTPDSIVSTSSTWPALSPQLASRDCRSSAGTCCKSAGIAADTQDMRVSFKD